MNSLFLVWEVVYLPSILNYTFAGQSTLGRRSLVFITLNTSIKSFLACKVSFVYFKYSLLIMLLQWSQFFSPLYLPSTLHPANLQHPLPQFMSIVYTYKFFGFSVSYTLLNFSLSILCLPLTLLIPYTFPLHSSPPPPH